jgi:hypothetical protein
LEKRREEFDKLWTKVVKDVNHFLENHEPTTDYSMQTYLRHAEKLSDELALSGAWIYDRLTGHSGVPHNSKYRGSLTKKIRKALGYTL